MQKTPADFFDGSVDGAFGKACSNIVLYASRHAAMHNEQRASITIDGNRKSVVVHAVEDVKMELATPVERNS